MENLVQGATTTASGSEEKGQPTMTNGNGSLVYTVEEAGAKLGLSRNGSYQAVQRGEIPAIRIGRLLKVPKSQFDAQFDALLGAPQAVNMAETAPIAPLSVTPPVALKVPRHKTPREPKVQVGVSLPIELNNKLVQAAIEHGVTLSREIVDRLVQTF